MLRFLWFDYLNQEVNMNTKISTKDCLDTMQAMLIYYQQQQEYITNWCIKNPIRDEIIQRILDDRSACYGFMVTTLTKTIDHISFTYIDSFDVVKMKPLFDRFYKESIQAHVMTIQQYMSIKQTSIVYEMIQDFGKYYYAKK